MDKIKVGVILALVVAVGATGYFIVKNDKPKTNSTSLPETSGANTSPTTTSSGPANSSSIKSLAGTGLTTVPSSLFDNSSIRVLDLSNNALTGALPGEIRKLSNLESLDASNNQLTGIPAEIGQLSKLITANFANNDISGLPNELGNLSNLQTLDLRGNPNVSQQDLSAIRARIPNAQILTD